MTASLLPLRLALYRYLVAAERAARDGNGAREGGEGTVDDGVGGVGLVSGVGDIASGSAEGDRFSIVDSKAEGMDYIVQTYLYRTQAWPSFTLMDLTLGLRSRQALVSKLNKNGGKNKREKRGAYNPVTGLQTPRASSVPLMS